MEKKAESGSRNRSGSVDAINMMQIRMLKADASPMKKRLVQACSHGMNSARFDVWVHIYDLGPMSKWLINTWNTRESGLGAFHCGVEVLGVEWSFQAMIDCETDEMTGVMCHTPKSHPRHVYRESIWLGGSPLCANEICNVLARLERDWPARSYHFLSHNCTDFAEALCECLALPTPFPAWAHGLAKGLVKKEGQSAKAPWWLPSGVNAVLGSCGSNSCASEMCTSDLKHGKVTMPCGASLVPGCDELYLAPKNLNTAYPNA
jgi:hypothetical protein